MCDNKRSKEGFKFHQLAAIVVEGGAAHAINRCKQCYTVMRMNPGERKLTTSRCREMIVQKAIRGKLWVAFACMEQLVRRMCAHFTINDAWAR